MISPRSRVVISLFLLSILGAIVTGRDVFYNLLYLWGTLLIFSFFWSRNSLRGIKVERNPRSLRAQVGRMFVERFTLINESRISKLWVEARDSSDIPGFKVTTLTVWLGRRGTSEMEGHRSSTVSVNLGSRHQRTWIVRTLCTRRGRFRLGPMVLESSDPFGLFPVSREVTHSQRLVVLPMTVPLWNFPIPSGHLPGGDALRRRTHVVTPNAASVRDYAPGDSFNRIHWPSTARRQRLIAKEFELDPLADVWIFLDAARKTQFELPEEQVQEDITSEDQPMQWLPPSTEEYGVAAAASLAMHFLQRDRAVGLLAHGNVRHVIQPDRGESQLYRILESLAVLEAVGLHSLEEVIKVEAPHFPRDTTVILITPSASSSLLTTVRYLMDGGRSPVLVLIDGKSFGGPVGCEEVGISAQREGIPIRILRCGEPLAASLGTLPRSNQILTAV